MQMEGRLHALLFRVNHTYKLKATIDHLGIIRLGSDALKKVRVVVGAPEKPTFLRHRKAFSREDLQDFYAVSESQGKKIVKDWTKQMWISRRGLGPKTWYICQDRSR